MRKAGDSRVLEEKEIIGKGHSSTYHQIQKRGYATPTDVLMKPGAAQKKYEDWRFGRVPFLESACTVNLHQLTIENDTLPDWLKTRGYIKANRYEYSIVEGSPSTAIFEQIDAIGLAIVNSAKA